jgi:hypothetical protein
MGGQTYEWDRKDRGEKLEGDEDTKWIKVQKNGSEDALLAWRGKEEGTKEGERE